MKYIQNKLFWLFFLGIVFTSCAQDKKKATTVSNAAVASSNFEVSLSKSFYMTGDAMEDLYINVTVNSGVIIPNTPIEIVKKENSSEKISGVLYKIEDKNYKAIQQAKAGQEVTVFLKLKNDKGFSLGYTGDQYLLVKKGQTPTKTEASKQKGMATVLVDGKPWKYDYYKVYHYTKDNGVTKNPANYLIVFTKKNKNLKNSPEEVLQISLFHAPQSPKQFHAKDIDFAFTTDMFGEERIYAKTFQANQNASASISAYTNTTTTAVISGNVKADTKAFLCSSCAMVKITVDFKDLEATIYNQ